MKVAAKGSQATSHTHGQAAARGGGSRAIGHRHGESAASLQRSAGNRAVSSLLAGGRPLDPDTRRGMESSFGQDFSGVRVHTGEAAERSALLMGAKAYTFGSNIVFGEDRYAPHSREGKRLLAHELAHVLQQTAGNDGQRNALDRGPEMEAANAGISIASGGSAAVHNAVAPSVQCDPLDPLPAEEVTGNLTPQQAQERLAYLDRWLADVEQRFVYLKRGDPLDNEEYKEKFAEQELLRRQLNAPVERTIPAIRGAAPKLTVPNVTPMAEETKRIHAEEHQRLADFAAINEQQRRLRADLEKTPEYSRSRPNIETPEGRRELLVRNGVPVSMMKRPLTGFEMQLKADKTVILSYPNTGAVTPPYPSSEFAPLADMKTGQVIGYATTTGADLTICDLNGRIIQQGDVPTTPSAVQPDDLIFIGWGVGKIGKSLVVAGGDALLTSGRRLSVTALRQLRGVTAAAMTGAAKAAPVLEGGFGRTAIVEAGKRTEQVIGGEMGNEVTHVLRVPPSAKAGIEELRASAQRAVRAPAKQAGASVAGEAEAAIQTPSQQALEATAKPSAAAPEAPSPQAAQAPAKPSATPHQAPSPQPAAASAKPAEAGAAVAKPADAAAQVVGQQAAGAAVKQAEATVQKASQPGGPAKEAAKQEQAEGSVQATQTPRAVWEYGNQVRGLTVEAAMSKLYRRMGPSRRMPKDFKGIDFISGGDTLVIRNAEGRRIGEVIENTLGISEKTLDLTGKSVQSARGISRVIKGHLNSLYRYESYSRKGITVSKLSGKVLNVYIGPGVPSPAQMMGINEAIEHAALNGIAINIVIF